MASGSPGLAPESVGAPPSFLLFTASPGSQTKYISEPTWFTADVRRLRFSLCFRSWMEKNKCFFPSHASCNLALLDQWEATCCIIKDVMSVVIMLWKRNTPSSFLRISEEGGRSDSYLEEMEAVITPEGHQEMVLLVVGCVSYGCFMTSRRYVIIVPTISCLQANSSEASGKVLCDLPWTSWLPAHLRHQSSCRLSTGTGFHGKFARGPRMRNEQPTHHALLHGWGLWLLTFQLGLLQLPAQPIPACSVSSYPASPSPPPRAAPVSSCLRASTGKVFYHAIRGIVCYCFRTAIIRP